MNGQRLSLTLPLKPPHSRNATADSSDQQEKQERQNEIVKQPVSLPVNWPADLLYLTEPMHSPNLHPDQLDYLHRHPTITHSSPQSAIPVISLLEPLNVKTSILPITNQAHPAYSQRGLFAATHLPPDSLITLYLGLVHSNDPIDTDRSSDYDISLTREQLPDHGISIDATRAGNEGRFVNDFRGVRPKGSETGKGPNAEFRDVWIEFHSKVNIDDNERRGPEKRDQDALNGDDMHTISNAKVKAKAKGGRGIGIFVLPAGKSGKRKAGIRAGEEILVSYGKGFWAERATEDKVGDL